jgi:hypothetical protein
MIDNINRDLIDDNLSEQPAHLLESRNSGDHIYLNVEHYVSPEAVSQQSTAMTAITNLDQEFNSFQYESKPTDQQFLDSVSFLNENSNMFMHPPELYNRNTCVTTIKNDCNLSSCNDINIVRYI